LKVFKTLTYLRTLLSREKESLEAFLEDLLNEKVISDVIRDKILRFRHVFDHWGWKQSPASFLRRVQAVFMSAKTRCLFLPSFDREFSAKEDVNTYSPRVEDFYTAICLTVETDGPDGDHSIAMLLEEEDIDDLIGILTLTRKQLNLAKLRLKTE
jgi:hypothetical protein